MSQFYSTCTAILYQNSAKSITLMDIPRSITVAQMSSCLEQPCSSLPLRTPYPSVEPKGEQKKTKFAQLQASTDIFPVKLFKEALDEVAQHWAGEWCLQRFVGNSHMLGKKVSRDEIFREYLSSVQGWSLTEPIMLPSEGVSQGKLSEMCNRLICNAHTRTVNIHLTASPCTYRVPPESCYFLSRINESTMISFSMAALQIFPTASVSSRAGPGQFDFIVLDPPWPNRSVRRAKEYRTTQHDDNPMTALCTMLGQHIAPGGLVACWITNKAAVRELAMQALAGWGVQLIEEWAWLKVTVDGQPATDIDGVWRKPYELLLIGRKSIPDGNTGKGSSHNVDNMKKKVMVAVSDFHSRKPNLKELVQPMLPDPLAYRALEIFARNLTAGWCAWGDEVLKYNDVLAWSEGTKDQAAT
ncbi:MAG: hypothetical protein Q9163_006104 [Psora crenata]